MGSGMKIVVFVATLLAPVLCYGMWLAVLGSIYIVASPRGCLYDFSHHSMDCCHANLTDVPHINHLYVKELFLDENKFIVQKKDMFLRNFRADVELLSLKNCMISNVSDIVFSALKVLKYLALDSNEITELKVGTFRNLTSLENLTLSSNEISELREGIFGDLQSLKLLNLNTNKISYIEANVFAHNSNLSELYLSRNRLSYVDPSTFSPLVQLERLYLDNNMDLLIPDNSSLLNVPSLIELDLSFCNTSSLSDMWFRHLRKLEVLNLDSNKLKQVDVNILVNLSSLKVLYLSRNPLQCDCRLLDVWKWYRERRIQMELKTFKRTTCSTPEKVKGMWWGVLEKAYCYDKKIKFLEGNESVVPENNSTKYQQPDKDIADFVIKRKTFMSVLFILLVVGVIGNVSVLITIIANPEMRIVPNFFVFNVALSDLLFLLLSLFFKLLIYFSEEWDIMGYICNFEVFINICLGSSVFSVTVLSIYRYYAVASPFESRAKFGKMGKFTYLCILATWVLSFIFCIPSLIVRYSPGHCLDKNTLSYTRYSLILLTVAFSVFPFCVMGASYVLVAIHLVRSRGITSNVSRLSQRFNTAGIVVGLVIVFMVSIMPYYIVTLYLNTVENRNKIFLLNVIYSRIFPDTLFLNTEHPFLTLSRWLLPYLNACCNPIALYLASNKFRKYFKKYFLRCCKRRPNKTNDALQLHNVS
ncbi:uncharacterized protein [Periplaneta americana]|uniref:uncharacterized protein n=1 Tax=Periplaneta americana TaxID=6978 RepID=UPI0037E79394